MRQLPATEMGSQLAQSGWGGKSSSSTNHCAHIVLQFPQVPVNEVVSYTATTC